MKIDELFWDSNVSIETLVWIASCVCDKPDYFTEMLESWPDEVLDALECSAKARDCGDDPDGLLEWCAINGKMGFLVMVKTPVDSSWGHCRLGWFYADTLDAAFVERLTVWRETVSSNSVSSGN